MNDSKTDNDGSGAGLSTSPSKALFDIVARSYGRGLCDREHDGTLMTDLIELPMTRDEADEFRRLLSNSALSITPTEEDAH